MHLRTRWRSPLLPLIGTLTTHHTRTHTALAQPFHRTPVIDASGACIERQYWYRRYYSNGMHFRDSSVSLTNDGLLRKMISPIDCWVTQSHTIWPQAIPGEDSYRRGTSKGNKGGCTTLGGPLFVIVTYNVSQFQIYNRSSLIWD